MLFVLQFVGALFYITFCMQVIQYYNITMGDQRWYNTKSCRLLCMLALTFSFFLVELIYGYITHSLALIGDSYHMLSDVVALGVGIASVRVCVNLYNTCNILVRGLLLYDLHCHRH